MDRSTARSPIAISLPIPSHQYSVKHKPLKSKRLLSDRPSSAWSCLLLAQCFFAGCDNTTSEPRVYNAPKEDTVFVVDPPRGPAPMMQGMPAMSGGAGIAAEEKRILGAIFPIGGSGYFLKITDTIARIDKIQVPMEQIVREFKVDADGKPVFTLPEGWSMGAGDAFALAKVSIPVPGESSPAIMTISALNGTDLTDPNTATSNWNDYVLMQMNRWNGQVSHAAQDIDALLASMTPVQREGDPVPAYVFDKNGSKASVEGAKNAPGAKPAESADASSNVDESKSEGDEKESSEPAPATEDSSVSDTAKTAEKSPELPPSAGPVPADAKMPNDANHAGLHGNTFDPNNLKYEVPEGWQLQPPRTFRLATFKIPGSEGERDGEVVLSLALDNPLENSKMWSEQILKTDDPAILDAKAQTVVSDAQPIASGDIEGKIYRIQGEQDAASNMLLVAVLPMSNLETSMFVKLSSSQRMAEEQQENLRRFVSSLRWE